MYCGLGCVQTRIDLWVPPSVGTLLTTGASLTGGGMSTKGGSTLPSLAGAKLRSTSTSYSCTISTPGISSSASAVCTPGRSVLSTKDLTLSSLLMLWRNSFSTSPITHPEKSVKIGSAGIPLAST